MEYYLPVFLYLSFYMHGLSLFDTKVPIVWLEEKGVYQQNVHTGVIIRKIYVPAL